MPKFRKQAEATSYIKNLLAGQGPEIQPGIILIGEDEPWQVFEHNGRCVGIDPNSGVWIGPSGGQWRCLASSCTVSAAFEAIEFLTQV